MSTSNDGVTAAQRVAQEAAPEAVRVLLGIMRRPRRGDAVRLAAVREVLRFAEAALTLAPGDSAPTHADDLTPQDFELMKRYLAERTGAKREEDDA